MGGKKTSGVKTVCNLENFLIEFGCFYSDHRPESVQVVGVAQVERAPAGVGRDPEEGKCRHLHER